MEVKATAKYQRMSAQKVRMMADLIRGCTAEEAINRLRFMPQKSARIVEKVVKSAVANAEDRRVGDVDDLRIARVWVDQGPMHKRIRPMPQGRAGRILKRTSHVTVVVSTGGQA